MRRFTRSVDATWQRSSYSSLSRVDAVAAPGVGSEPEVVGKDDESFETSEEIVASAPATPSVLRRWRRCPVGATFGSLVHAVLEHTDPDAPDLRAELLGHIDEQLGWWPVERGPLTSWPMRWSRCATRPSARWSAPPCARSR